MYHDWTKGPCKEETLLTFKEADMVVRGELHVISGQTATCKSLLALDFMSSCLNDDLRSSLSVNACSHLNVLLVDTEQSAGTINYRLRTILSDAIRCRGFVNLCRDLAVLKLDALTPTEIFEQMTKAIIDRKADLVIIDGVVDLTENFNDPCESRRLVQALRNMAVHYNLAVVVLIHENPHTDKARGHLGTILLQKCWRAWSLERSGNVVKVSCVKARGESHPAFAFVVEPTTLTLSQVPITESVKDKVTCRDLIFLILRRGPITRAEIYSLLSYYKSPRTLENELAKQVALGKIVENRGVIALV